MAKEYAETVASGHQWLGQIPAHWYLSPLGSHFDPRSETVSDVDYAPLSVTKDGVVPQMANVAKTDNNTNRKLVRTGDFVINSRSDRKGSAGLSALDGSTSIVYAVLSPRPSVDGRFVHHLLRSHAFQEEFYRWGNGIVDDLWSTRYSSMKRIALAVPPLEEQRAIADYLDRETARIDTLIEEQQRLIEMLRERRQALVERSMLDSSDAPIRLSRIASSRSGDVPPPLEEDGKHVVWGAGRVVGRTSQSNAQAGDLLVGRVGQGSVGKVRRLTENAWATDNTIVLRLDLSAADPRYIEHGLRLIPRFELVGGGAMPLVTAERLLAQPVPFTTLATQQRIAEHLEQQTAKIDLLISETEWFIELSKERRSALITAAVTGQIDVREIA